MRRLRTASSSLACLLIFTSLFSPRLGGEWSKEWGARATLPAAQDPDAQTSVTLHPPANGAEAAALIQRALDQFSTVQLAAGTAWNVGGPIYLRDGDSLTTDRHNPATIRRTGNTTQLLVINGLDTRLTNLQLDWNFGGRWREYTSLISFQIADWLPEQPRQRGRNYIANVDFVCSSGMGQHGDAAGQNWGDCWCVSLATDAPEISEDIRVVGCRSLAEGVQLTGNGSGPGYRGLLIGDCEVYGGYANSIAISGRTADSQTVFSGITIERNVIRDARVIGIFVGQDSEQLAADLWIDGLVIRNNHIELAGGHMMYQMGILIRGGQAEGCHVAAVVENNTFDLRNAGGRQPRWLNMVPAKSGGTLDLNFNHMLGPPADSQAIGVEVRQSGNRQVDDRGSVELKVAA